MSKQSVLRLKKVSKVHGKSNLNSIQAFFNINLDLKVGETVGLLGPSGSGKSTLLHISGLLDRPSDGEVYVLGNAVSSLTETKRTALRRNTIGFVYQFNNLLPEFNALENVILPQLISGVSKHLAHARARELIDKVGLSERIYHRPFEMSGGEQQRIAICRAIANQPEILLADEPTGNLDTKNSEMVIDLIISIAEETKMSALIATHNVDLVKKLDRVIKLGPDGVKEWTKLV